MNCTALPVYAEELTSVHETVISLRAKRDALWLAQSAVLKTVRPIEENVLPHVLKTADLDHAEYVQAAYDRAERKLDYGTSLLTYSRAAADTASDDCTEKIQQDVLEDTSRAYDVCPRIQILRLLEDSVDGEVQ